MQRWHLGHQVKDHPHQMLLLDVVNQDYLY